MKALTTILIILVLIFCGIGFYKYWESVRDAEEQKVATTTFNPNNLTGFPSWQLEEGHKAAVKKGPKAVGEWLKQYGHLVNDPRRAWIELDYCVSVTRDDPPEAKRVFNEVKGRLSTNSPVWPRVEQLQKSY